MTSPLRCVDCNIFTLIRMKSCLRYWRSTSAGKQTHNTGRHGMDLWRILVLAVLKQGLGCDYDRLHWAANRDSAVRLMIGHDEFDDNERYTLKTPKRNVSLLSPAKSLMKIELWMLNTPVKR
ncbi:MAG: hypothetical protein OXD01_01365 [Gammaproteobacteria bacterium]|nr:hypothetical protein [Gammaproteobacteria bacterium]